MSRSAHAQSTYVLHELPKCLKCKCQLQLVMARYENEHSYRLVEEWECPKCGKYYPLNKMKEEQLSEQDRKLHEWCKKEQKRNKKQYK